MNLKIKHDSSGPRTVHECVDCKPHTPTPWKYEIVKDHWNAVTGIKILDAEGIKAACAWEECDAAYIVRAVNCHEELVSMLKELSECGDFEFVNEPLRRRVDKLIAKAEGK